MIGSLGKTAKLQTSRELNIFFQKRLANCACTGQDSHGSVYTKDHRLSICARWSTHSTWFILFYSAMQSASRAAPRIPLLHPLFCKWLCPTAYSSLYIGELNIAPPKFLAPLLRPKTTVPIYKNDPNWIIINF